MNTIINSSIREKYMSGFDRETKDITEVVIHGTGGGQSAMAIINWMLGGERAELYKKGIGLFHYEIDLNGDVYEIINPLKWVYHSESGFHDKNTIGIELLNTMPGNTASYTKEQYDSLSDLLVILCGLFPVSVITSHDSNRMKYSGLQKKNCPGSTFDWSIVDGVAIDKIKTSIEVRR